jgi:hypothetical protein
MIPTRSSPARDGAFDEFLFAPVGEERNGMALSVLSALARLGIDPWADAARLSQLPRDSAIAALGQSIALLPPGAWLVSDATDIATRLVELLPKPGARPKTVPASASASASASGMPADWKRRTTLVLALLSFGLGVYLLFGATRVEHRAADGVQVESERR